MEPRNGNIVKLIFKNEEVFEIERIMWALNYTKKDEFIKDALNQWISIYNGEINDMIINKIYEPEQDLKRKKTEYKNIFYLNGRFQVRYSSKYIGTFRTLEEAIEAKNNYIKNMNKN